MRRSVKCGRCWIEVPALSGAIAAVVHLAQWLARQTSCMQRHYLSRRRLGCRVGERMVAISSGAASLEHGKGHGNKKLFIGDLCEVGVEEFALQGDGCAGQHGGILGLHVGRTIRLRGPPRD